MRQYLAHFHWIVILNLLILPASWSDQVKLENGDLLSGTITSMQDGELTLQSSYMGELSLPWDKIVWIESEQPLYVQLQNGDQIHLQFITDHGEQKMTSEVVGEIQLDLDEILSLSQESSTALQPELQAAQETIDSLTKELSTAHDEIKTLEKQTDLKELWKGHITLQGNMRSGNRESYNAFLGAEAKRTTPQEELILGANASYGETEDVVDTTEGKLYSDLRIFYAESSYLFGSLMLEHDRFENLDFRIDGTVGHGHRLWKTDRSEFIADYGFGLTEEIYKDGTEVTEAITRLHFDYYQLLFEATEFNQKFIIYPSMGHFGEYRFISTTSLMTPISDVLSWNITLVDEYKSNPRPDVKKNDVSIRTGLMYKF